MTYHALVANALGLSADTPLEELLQALRGNPHLFPTPKLLLARAEVLRSHGHTDAWRELAVELSQRRVTQLEHMLQPAGRQDSRLRRMLASQYIVAGLMLVVVVVVALTGVPAAVRPPAPPEGATSMFQMWLEERQLEEFMQLVQQSDQGALEPPWPDPALEEPPSLEEQVAAMLQQQDPETEVTASLPGGQVDPWEEIFNGEPMKRDSGPEGGPLPTAILLVPDRPFTCGALALQSGCSKIRFRTGPIREQRWRQLENLLTPLILDGRCAQAEELLKTQIPDVRIRERAGYSYQLTRIGSCYQQDEQWARAEQIGAQVLCISVHHLAHAYSGLFWGAQKQSKQEALSDTERRASRSRARTYVGCMETELGSYAKLVASDPQWLGFAHYILGTIQWMELSVTERAHLGLADRRIAAKALGNLSKSTSLMELGNEDEEIISHSLINAAEVMVALARRDDQMPEVFRKVMGELQLNVQGRLEMRTLYLSWLLRTKDTRTARDQLEILIRERERRTSAEDSFDWTSLLRWLNLEESGDRANANAQIERIIGAITWPPAEGGEQVLQEILSELTEGEVP